MSSAEHARDEASATPAGAADGHEHAAPTATEGAAAPALLDTAVDLTLGLVAVGFAGLRQAPELAAKIPVRAASLALDVQERAQQEVGGLLTRGAELRGRLNDLLAGRLFTATASSVDEEPGEPDPFDLLLVETGDEADQGHEGGGDEPVDTEAPPTPPRVPFVIVPPGGDTAPSAPSAPEPTGGEDLPLEGFDQMTLGVLRVRARTLDIPQLQALLTHEERTGRREGVLSLLETRIAQLEQEQSPG